MGVIATLLPQVIQINRLRAAIRDRHDVCECADWQELTRTCDREPIRLAVVDLFSEPTTNLEAIRQLKQRMPRLTLVAYVNPLPGRTHDLFDAARAGVEGLVLTGEDDAPRSLLALIEQAEAKSLAGLVRRSFEGIDPMVTDAVLLSVARAHERLSSAGLARLLAQPRRAVCLRLEAEGFPGPQRLLTWGRLIVAAHMLEDRHRSAERVAATLDFASGSAFRNICQRYVHATPGEIRSRGGANYVVRAMLRQVNERLANATDPRMRSTPGRRPAVAL